MGGVSTIGYTYQDHFSVDEDGNKIDNFVEAPSITTFQVKGGGRYNLDDRLSAFANFGYVQKPPILDNVIDYDGNVSTNPDNEKFISLKSVENMEVIKLLSKVVIITLNGKIETLQNL